MTTDAHKAALNPRASPLVTRLGYTEDMKGDEHGPGYERCDSVFASLGKEIRCQRVEHSHNSGEHEHSFIDPKHGPVLVLWHD